MTQGASKGSGYFFRDDFWFRRGACDTAVFLQTMGAIYGPSGIGKSLTLDALLSRFAGSMLMTITDSSNTVTTCLKELMERLGIDARKEQAPMRLAVCNHLRNSQRLLMFDEAHLADLRLLNTPRQVHDDTGCPTGQVFRRGWL